MVAAILVINVKFTGLVYVAVLLPLAALVVWAWYGVRLGRRLAAAGLVAGVFGALVIGYSPYVHNLVEHRDPFYSAPRSGVAGYRPVNLQDENRVMRFLLSSFSRTDSIRAPDSTRLKLPFSIHPEERRGVYGADLEIGGFGPLYGAMLLLAGACALALAWRASTRQRAFVVLVIAGWLAASMFTHGDTWWARYVPQAWLIPLLVAIAGQTVRQHAVAWCLAWGIVVVGFANLAIVGANVAWNSLTYRSATVATLGRLAATPHPVTVYLGPFPSLRRRLNEAGVDFTSLESRPTAVPIGGSIPAPGGFAIWFE
jgi:hypothetical protein